MTKIQVYYEKIIIYLTFQLHHYLLPMHEKDHIVKMIFEKDHIVKVIFK